MTYITWYGIFNFNNTVYNQVITNNSIGTAILLKGTAYYISIIYIYIYIYIYIWVYMIVQSCTLIEGSSAKFLLGWF